MWKISADHIPSTHALRVLRKAKVQYVSDILDYAGINIKEFAKANSTEIVAKFCENCEALSGFGNQSRKALSTFLESHKSQILDHYFIEITKLRNVPREDDESDEDHIPDLGSLLPVETLLIDVTIIKGSIEFACIEEVIADMEQEISDTDDNLTDDEIHEIVMEAFEIDQWPTDRPIYISSQAAVVYPELVVNLTKRALLVLK